MSEHAEKHAVAKLIGSPAGYVGYDDGGLLTDAVRKSPDCVLLLDEIEKAHSDIFNIMDEDDWIQYLNLDDNVVKKALEVFRRNEAFPKNTSKKPTGKKNDKVAMHGNRPSISAAPCLWHSCILTTQA